MESNSHYVAPQTIIFIKNIFCIATLIFETIQLKCACSTKIMLGKIDWVNLVGGNPQFAIRQREETRFSQQMNFPISAALIYC